MIENNSEKEKALLVSIDTNSLDEDIELSMKELEELAEAAGAEVISQVIQPRASKDPATYVGKGKAEEIRSYCEELDIDIVIFNDELSGSQMRNLSEIIDRDIIDRTNLILDIFAQRATSNEGKLQVKLAQLKYRLPRLTGLGKAMSRTGGGIGTRGPGEQKLETDRRHIQREIKNIENELEKVKKNREQIRVRREKNSIPIIALAGYTNSGKSSLMNRLIDDDEEKTKSVFVKDMLFATLGTYLRRAKFPFNSRKFILIDTVGFVSKLPTHLVEAFKSTLEEIEYADLIIHVVDIYNQDSDMQIDTTNKILADMKLSDKPMVYAFNKIDLLGEEKNTYLMHKYKPSAFISAKENLGIDDLLEIVYNNLPNKIFRVKLFFSYSEQDMLNTILEKYTSLSIEYKENGTLIEVEIEERDRLKYEKNIVWSENV